MRFFSYLLALAAVPLALADRTKWADLASKSKNGIIKLDSAMYDELLASDREYSALVLLTALAPQFKCQPCHNFQPSFDQVAASWRKKPAHVRDEHFFASLDFVDGQAVYQRLGLSSAPTIQFHPAAAGPNKSNKLSVISYDLNRQGLAPEPLHSFISPLTPETFGLHRPFNPIPFIVIPTMLAVIAFSVYTMWDYLLPLVQSRIIWGVFSVVFILTFISGHMWNKIKNAPYIAVGQGGAVSWVANGYQNQLGIESQVVAGIYGLLAFSIVALTVFVPAQSSPAKQRVGVYLWLGILIVVFSLLFRLFKMKNGAYPFGLLF